MSRQVRALLLELVAVTQLTAACVGAGTPQSPPAASETSPWPATASSPTTVSPSTEYPGCVYTWATRELPLLTDTVQSALGALGPEVSGSAYAFGEECAHQDGSTSFLAMETDFRVAVHVDSLSDENSLGKWIADVMSEIQALAPQELAGTRPGRVEFEFDTVPEQSLRLNIDLASYQADSAGLKGGELFQRFANP